MRRHVTVLAALATLLVAALAPLPTHAMPPKGDAFGGVMIFQDPMSGETVMLRACVRFVNKRKICVSEQECGTWRFTERHRHRNSWEGEILLDFDGTPLMFQFYGMTENSGKANARAVSAIGYVADASMNAAMAAVRMTLEQCVAFASVQE